MIKEHKQFNLERKTPEANGGDFVSAPNTARTDKDLIVKDLFNVNNTETQQLHGQRMKTVELVSGGNTTHFVRLNEYLVGISDVVVSRGVQLPRASLAGVGKVFVIKDMSGSASATTIAISPIEGELIDGDTSDTLNVDYDLRKYFSNGTNWFTY